MLRLKNATKLCVVAITLMLMLSSFPKTVSAQSPDLDPIVIMYEASHNPQFAADETEVGLKLMLDMINASTRYLVQVNEDELNDTILNDVDVLIIADPDTNAAFETTELVAIDEMLTNGSSLFVLGDPSIDQNSTYWDDVDFRDVGENLAVNGFLDAMNITGVRFSLNVTGDEADPDYRGDTMFDYEKAINATFPSVIQLDTTTWDTTHPIFRDINSLVTMTATFKPIGVASSIATGYDSSFAQYRRGPNTFGNLSYPNMTLTDFAEAPLSYSAINGTFPSWLSAFEFSESRVVVCGSTIMFSGMALDIEDSEETWFYQGDNARLFMNILAWLTEGFVETPDATMTIAVVSSIILIIGVAFYLFKKIR